MQYKIGINGLGRIGKCLIRAIYELGYKDLKISAINTPAPIDTIIHLLKYDSIHGKFNAEIAKSSSNNLVINGEEIKVFNCKTPPDLHWQVDLVLECTGIFNDAESLHPFIQNGAKKVLLSSPGSNMDINVIYGVNQDKILPKHQFISAGSCTSNCLIPIVNILHQELQITSGFMTTIHAYTRDQNILDGTHKDLRRARACNLSMIPTKTGAAKLIGEIIPELKNKIDGEAVRVPVANVSMIDFTFTSARATSVEQINQIFEKAATDKKLKDVITVTHDPIVSIDCLRDPHSAVVDLLSTKVINNNFNRVVAWYDNEWGFTARMLDLARHLQSHN